MSTDSDKSLVGAVAQVAGDVYKDLAQPSTKRVGQALDGLLKIGLSPLAIIDWGFEKSKDWLAARVAKRLEQIPTDSVIPPDDRIAIPVLIGIASSSATPELRDLYAELLLKALDRRTADHVHPAYVSTVGQLSPSEALAFFSLRNKIDQNVFQDRETSDRHNSSPTIDDQFMSYCSELGLAQVDSARFWLENLRRLGLLWIERFSDVRYHEVDGGLGRSRVSKDEYRNLRFTEFGKRFLEACTPQGPTYDDEP